MDAVFLDSGELRHEPTFFQVIAQKGGGAGWSNFRHITAKKFKRKNGNSLCLKSFKFVTIRLVKMVKKNKLCLVFVKYVIGLKIYGVLY